MCRAEGGLCSDTHGDMAQVGRGWGGVTIKVRGVCRSVLPDVVQYSERQLCTVLVPRWWRRAFRLVRVGQWSLCFTRSAFAPVPGPAFTFS